MKPTDAAYLAGLIDGEGSIIVKQDGCGVRLHVSNQSKLMINWLKEHCPEWHHQQYDDCDRMTIDDRKVIAKYLAACLPYLTTKKREAQLMLFYISKVQRMGPGRGYSDEMHVIANLIKEKMLACKANRRRDDET